MILLQRRRSSMDITVVPCHIDQILFTFPSLFFILLYCSCFLFRQEMGYFDTQSSGLHVAKIRDGVIKEFVEISRQCFELFTQIIRKLSI